MKNLIMTTLINYNFDIHYRFIGTLYDSINDNNLDLVLFISKNDENHIIKIIKLLNKPIIYNIIDESDIHIVNLRFRLYYDYLNNNKNYNLIFLCDSRDVIFQKNIFNHPIINNIYDLYFFYEESNNITIDKCKFNSLYVKKTKLDLFDSIYNKKIICAGTILGKINGILDYLFLFNNILDNEIEENDRNLYGIDAGINYKIIYNNLLNHLTLKFCSNSHCLVYTMAFPIHLNLINYNKLLNSNNQILYNSNIVYCIHQYDRLNDDIKKKLSIKYNLII